MATELIKIQSYISSCVADQLIAYKKAHHLRSTSEAIAAILADFLGTTNGASDELTPPFLGEHLKQLEDRMSSLVSRIEALERDRQVAPFLGADAADRNGSVNLVPTSTQSHSVTPAAMHPTRSNGWTSPAATPHLDELQQPALSVESGAPEFIHDESLDELLDPAQTETSAEMCASEMLKGISASLLVRRLQTTPTTLRKHLRDASRPAWAVERDSNGWGWIYEPLLQRYYPVHVNADGSVRAVELNDIGILDEHDANPATAVRRQKQEETAQH